MKMSARSSLPARIHVITSWEDFPALVRLVSPSPQRATRAKVSRGTTHLPLTDDVITIKSKCLFRDSSSFNPLPSWFSSHADIDECSQGSHMCHYNQQCVNTVGTYRCQAKCGPGFKPSITGTSCEGKSQACFTQRLCISAVSKARQSYAFVNLN